MPGATLKKDNPGDGLWRFVLDCPCARTRAIFTTSTDELAAEAGEALVKLVLLRHMQEQLHCVHIIPLIARHLGPIKIMA